MDRISYCMVEIFHLQRGITTLINTLFSGYYGTDCHMTCPHGTYGLNCAGSCACVNGGACDPVTGDCTCKAGYQGI